MATQTIRVLFLCTGNSARSQMAEALLRRIGGAQFEVFSAGTNPQGVNPLTREVMAEISEQLEGHSSKDLEELPQLEFDYVITLCGDAAETCPAFPGQTARVHWALVDPAAATGIDGDRLSAFRRTRDEINMLVSEFVASFQAAF